MSKYADVFKLYYRECTRHAGCCRSSISRIWKSRKLGGNCREIIRNERDSIKIEEVSNLEALRKKWGRILFSRQNNFTEYDNGKRSDSENISIESEKMVRAI
jgi:hypothetical protein